MGKLSGARVVGAGAGSLDYFSPVLDLERRHDWPEYTQGIEFEPGGKADLRAADEWRFDQLRQSPSVESKVGGNMLNALASLSIRYEVETLSVGMALGVDDIASVAIREEMHRLGIRDTSIGGPHYQPSESMILRACDERGKTLDRMVLGRPRSPLQTLVDRDYIHDTLSGADLVVAASLKDSKVNKWVCEAAKPDAFLAWNFGSSELRDYPDELRAMLEKRPADLLSLNVQEAQQLLGVKTTMYNPLYLLKQAMPYAKAVVLTDGEAGLYAARRTKLDRAGVRFELGACSGKLLSPESIKDTLGAGDAVNGAAIAGFVMELKVQDIAEMCAEAGAEAVQHVGAHEYLFGGQSV